MNKGTVLNENCPQGDLILGLGIFDFIIYTH